MRVEYSGISCGVRRLIIDSGDEASQDELGKLIKANQGGCAMLLTGAPVRRKDMTKLLLANGFERIKNTSNYRDPSVNAAFVDMAYTMMFHDHEYNFEEVDDDMMFEQFLESTVQDNLADMATQILHHGTYVGSQHFFVRHSK